MTLYVARHGEVSFNAEGRYAGSTDIPLNETGMAQARELAEKLSGERFDAVASSSMLRARQTAEIVCEKLKLPCLYMDYFVERCMGVYEGLTRNEAAARYPEIWSRLSSNPIDDAPTGGETIIEVEARILKGLEVLARAHPDGNVLLICHGFVSRAINRIVMELSYEEMQGFRLKNCEFFRYNVEGTIFDK